MLFAQLLTDEHFSETRHRHCRLMRKGGIGGDEGKGSAFARKLVGIMGTGQLELSLIGPDDGEVGLLGISWLSRRKGI